MTLRLHLSLRMAPEASEKVTFETTPAWANAVDVDAQHIVNFARAEWQELRRCRTGINSRPQSGPYLALTF